ncbi:MAG: hypothetical protein GY705_18315 [Bacteroidetes bacterium]|nr:hypothetical protein [Bacteroidota bacterium]
MNHWYVSGAYYLDSGWFSFLASHSVFPEMKNPPFLPMPGSSYLETHITPIFWILSILKNLFKFVPDPVYFSITQGVWAGIIGGVVFKLAFREFHRIYIPFFISLLCALNGITLATIGFPHSELAIPAFLLLFLYLYVQKSNLLYLGIVLLLLLFIREDAGLHAFGLFAMICIHSFFTKDITQFKKSLLCASIFLIYAVTAIVFQKVFYNSGDNSLTRMFIGNPPFSHIDLPLILRRLSIYFHHREYIYLPLLISIIWALIKKDWLLLLGTVSVIPWLLFSFFAISDIPGILVSYYSFPLMIFLLWPSISGLISKTQQFRSYLYLQVIVCGLSAILLSGNQGLHDPYPLKNMGFTYLNYYSTTNKALESILINHKSLGNIIADDALRSFYVGEDEITWKYKGNFSDSELENYDSILYFSNSNIPGTYQEISIKNGFSFIYRVENTMIRIASKSDIRNRIKTIPLSTLGAK